jgi:hypothetical protein
MAISATTPDYYAVLQVHPDADFEVIEAAYRQLMKKHHPDRAGDDPRQIEASLTRAKAINAAFGVLRDPEQRRRYDLDRLRNQFARGTSTRSTPPPPPPRPPNPPPQAAASAEAVVVLDPARGPSSLWAPLALLSAAYYLLPGPYEWEGSQTRDILSVLLLPVDVTAAFSLATGRLSPWIGHSLTALVMAWAILVLFVVVTTWGNLTRVGLASLPSAALLTAPIGGAIQQAHVPLWLAWGLVSCVSLVLAARVYVFGVLPAIAICWLLTSLS